MLHSRFYNKIKIQKLKTEFGVVEDGRLQKLLGVRYKWENIEDADNAKVILSMNDKAAEIIRSYEKATGLTPRLQKTPGKPGEILIKKRRKSRKTRRILLCTREINVLRDKNFT